MSVVKLGSNIASLSAQRRLSDSTHQLSKTFERLSSGLRINRASDDAAGLAISESLRADTKIFTQGIRNLNDGISLFNIAETAIDQLSAITTRLTELAEQAASGSYSHVQRKALDAEAQALSKEFFRISKTTTFNGRDLLGGSLGQVNLQAGLGDNSVLSGGVGGAIGTGTFGGPASYAVGSGPYSIATADFNGDGVMDLVTADFNSDTASVLLGLGNGSFAARVSYAVGDSPYSVATGDFNSDGVLDLVTADFSSGTASVLLGLGDGSFAARVSYAAGSGPVSIATADFNGDGVMDLVTADFNSDTANVLLGLGNGSFAARVSYAVGDSPYSVATGDFNSDGVLDLVTADFSSGTASVLLGLGDGSFAARVSYAVGDSPYSVATGDFNGDGVMDLVTADYSSGTASVLLGLGDGSFAARVSYAVGLDPSSIATADFNGDGVMDLVTANFGSDTVSVLLGQTKSGAGPLLPFSLKTMADARQALSVFKQKLDQLAAQRGQIGAFQSRIAVASNVLQVTSENFKAAESRIRDADTAQDSAELVRLNILQQAASSVLAQANQQPELALRLLQNE